MDTKHVSSQLSVAVLIPCYNEGLTVAKVVGDFQRSIPGATVYVYDNASTDGTSSVARDAGAHVGYVGYKGKGNVVRQMFSDIDADVYVLVDGDATYDATSAPSMIQALRENNFDTVIGCRTEESTQNNNYRRGHRLGNLLLTSTVQRMFGGQLKDMLSGYRIFSRRFVKSFIADSQGFEIETELTVHTLEMRLPYGEVDTPYDERPEGSTSKLSTYKDGLKILSMIITLYSHERPKQFWGMIGGGLLLIASVLVIPVAIEFINTGEVPRFPTFIAAIALGICGFLSLTIGLVLRTVTIGRREAKRLAYLSYPSTNRNE